MTPRQFIAAVSMLAVALALDGWTFAGAPWNVRVSTSSPSSWFVAGTYTSSQGFAEIQMPTGATLPVGQVISITNVTVTLNHGVLSISGSSSNSATASLAASVAPATNISCTINFILQGSTP